MLVKDHDFMDEIAGGWGGGGEDGGEGSMEASRVDADLVMMLQAQILKSAFSSSFI